MGTLKTALWHILTFVFALVLALLWQILAVWIMTDPKLKRRRYLRTSEIIVAALFIALSVCEIAALVYLGGLHVGAVKLLVIMVALQFCAGLIFGWVVENLPIIRMLERPEASHGKAL